MIVLFATTILQIVRYGDYLPPSASAHGVDVDKLMLFNLYLILFVFFVVNTLLFVFANKYRYDKNRKAQFFAHDNKLELIWTIIPSIVLAVIIIYGLRTWVDMTGPSDEDALTVELYSKQFDWTARYSGNDGEFGVTNFNTITPTNPLGIVTQEGVDDAIAKLEGKISVIRTELNSELGHLLAEQEEIEAELHPDDHGHHGHAEEHHMSNEQKHHLEARLHEIEELLLSENVTILTEGSYDAREDKIYRLERHKQRLIELEPFNFNENLSAWDAGRDDRIVKGEFHLPLGQEIEFIFRSRDVIHSAFMPHFRAQMNTVPGLPTRFKFTPTITTDSMRTILEDPEFDYILLCNKICGAAHFNMSMNIIVETPEEFAAWLAEQDEYLTEEEN
jgi:cytochrome c oxidase subunit 2